MGRHHMKGGSECHSTEQLSRLVEHHPTSAKDMSSLHQFGPQVLSGIFHGYVLSSGGIWKGNVMVADLKNWRRWTHQNSTSEDSMQRKCWRRWKVSISHSQSQMEQSKILEEIRIWERPPSSGSAQTEEKNKIIFEENPQGLLQPRLQWKTTRKLENSEFSSNVWNFIVPN